MADPALKIYLMELRNQLDDELYKPWKVVANKIGTAYAAAYKNHVANLPAHVPIASDFPALAEQVGVPAAAAYLGWAGPKGVVLVPIVIGVNSAVKYLYKQPRSEKIEMPATTDWTPEKFKGSLEHSLDVPFIKILKYLGDASRATGPGETIPRVTTTEIWNMIGLSPLSHLPKNWSKWNVDELAGEFERKLWVAWLTQTATGKPPPLGNYNYDKALGRIAALTGDLEKLSEMYTDDEKRSKVNTMTFIQMLKWSQSYKPKVDIVNTLPQAVLSEMYKLTKGPVNDPEWLLLGSRRLVKLP